MEPAAKLTAKQLAFCKAYSVKRNGTKAAKEAGYSEKTAAVQAFELLQKTEIKAYIEFLEAEKVAEADISKADIVLELKKIGFANIGEFMEFGERDLEPNSEDQEVDDIYQATGGGAMRIKHSSGLSKEQLAAISEVSETRGKFGTTTKFKLHSKLDALKTLADLLGHKAPEKKEVTVTEGNLEKTNYSLKKRPPLPGNEKTDQQSQSV